MCLTHDAAGNVTRDATAGSLGDGQGGVPAPSGQVYEYDEENRLKAVRRASDNVLLLEIAYDGVGRRVVSTDHLNAGAACGSAPVVTRHVYAGLETLEEHLSCDGGMNFTLVREFLWGERFPEPVAMVTHGGVAGGVGGAAVPAGESVYHYLHDALGSVVALTNASGRVVERYTYDPYGRTVVEQANLVTGVPTGRLDASAYGNPFAWTGQRYDPGVKLYHFLFRSYSPQLGRWLQRDPIGYADGSNLYEYVTSSPLRWLDPLGLAGEGDASDPAGDDSKDKKKKCPKHSDAVFGETAGLRPQWKDPKKAKEDEDYRKLENYDPESEKELHEGRKAVAEVAENREKADREGGINEKTPTDKELKNPDTRREWEKSQKAAEDAEKNSGLPDDAEHFYLRKGNKTNKDGTYRDKPKWARGKKPYKSYGPFRNLGGGDVPKGDDIYIDVYRGIK